MKVSQGGLETLGYDIAMDEVFGVPASIFVIWICLT